ncbi:MAG: VWA domain-containing protein [Thermaceae bacterium]|nr:VWA domain-containing protein [Thermaceae bacterium]
MLGLRAAVVVGLLLAAWGPNLPLQPVRTVVLLDQSPSDREAVWKAGAQLEFPRAQYLAFASSTAQVASPAARRLDLGNGTNLAQALKQAQTLHPDRIVLVSDGLFQGQVQLPSVPIYGLYQPPSPNLSLSLVAPALPTKGETVEVRAILESTAQTQAKLVLSGPGGTLTRDLQVQPGRSSVGYRFALEASSTVTARIQSPLGTKEVQLELTPADSTRVWVLGDATLAAYLKAQGFSVELRQHLSLPIRAEVVVLGVGASDLSGSELDALQSFLDGGGSLLWTATPKGLFFGGWERTSLADTIPLTPVEEPGGVGLVLVLDVSGSMADANKLGLAVGGALELIQTARPQDYIGVVTFSFGPHWLFKPRPMTEQGRKEAQSLLLTAEAGGGTVMGGAYREAVRAVANTPTKSKQLLVLTDGLVEDNTAGILQAAQSAVPAIKTSTVALGSDADQGFLKNLAKAGGGSFWDVPSPQDLPRFFLEQAQRVFKRKELVGRFGVVLRPHPVTRGLNPPPLSVILPAKSQPWAQSLITSGAGTVLAVGESGRGRVAALATDLSRSWRGWPGAAALVGELTRWLAQTPARPQVEAVRQTDGVKVSLEGQFEQPILRFGGLEQPFAPSGPLRYEAYLPVTASGEAVVLEGEQPRLKLVLPAQPEWRLENGKQALERLAEASGGRLLNTPADLSSLTGYKPLNLRPYLLALALGLLLLERYLERRRLISLSTP